MPRGLTRASVIWRHRATLPLLANVRDETKVLTSIQNKIMFLYYVTYRGRHVDDVIHHRESCKHGWTVLDFVEEWVYFDFYV